MTLRQKVCLVMVVEHDHKEDPLEIKLCYILVFVWEYGWKGYYIQPISSPGFTSTVTKSSSKFRTAGKSNHWKWIVEQ